MISIIPIGLFILSIPYLGTRSLAHARPAADRRGGSGACLPRGEVAAPIADPLSHLGSSHGTAALEAAAELRRFSHRRRIAPVQSLALSYFVLSHYPDILWIQRRSH